MTSGGYSCLGQVTLTGSTRGNNEAFTVTGTPCDLVVLVQNENTALAVLATVAPSVGVSNGDGATLPAATSVVPRATLLVPAADLVTAGLSVKLQWLNYVAGSSSVLAYATVYALQPPLLSKRVNVEVAANSLALLVAGVAGKSVTVFGWEGSIDPYAVATTGYYDVVIEDTTAAVAVTSKQLHWATDVGIASLPIGPVSLQVGIRLPVGAGLQIATPSTNSGAVNLELTVWYTQI